MMTVFNSSVTFHAAVVRVKLLQAFKPTDSAQDHAGQMYYVLFLFPENQWETCNPIKSTFNSDIRQIIDQPLSFPTCQILLLGLWSSFSNNFCFPLKSYIFLPVYTILESMLLGSWAKYYIKLKTAHSLTYTTPQLYTRPYPRDKLHSVCFKE